MPSNNIGVVFRRSRPGVSRSADAKVRRGMTLAVLFSAWMGGRPSRHAAKDLYPPLNVVELLRSPQLCGNNAHHTWRKVAYMLVVAGGLQLGGERGIAPDGGPQVADGILGTGGIRPIDLRQLSDQVAAKSKRGGNRIPRMSGFVHKKVQ